MVSVTRFVFLIDIYKTDLITRVTLFRTEASSRPRRCVSAGRRGIFSASFELRESGEENTVICPQFNCVAKPCFVPPVGFHAEEWNLPLSSVSLAELFIALSRCAD